MENQRGGKQTEKRRRQKKEKTKKTDGELTQPCYRHHRLHLMLPYYYQWGNQSNYFYCLVLLIFPSYRGDNSNHIPIAAYLFPGVTALVGIYCVPNL